MRAFSKSSGGRLFARQRLQQAARIEALEVRRFLHSTGTDHDHEIAPAPTESRSSPFAPQEANDHRFVFDSGAGLDTSCSFNDLFIQIPIERHVGDLQKLLQNGLISPQITIQMPAFDVDVNGAPGFPPEQDDVYLINSNGSKKIGTLTGDNQIWVKNKFTIDTRDLVFAAADGTPGMNTIRIDVDVQGPGNWCTAIDWIQIDVEKIPAPTLFAHGILSEGRFWNDVFRPMLTELGVPSETIDLGNLDSIGANAGKISTKVEQMAQLWGVDKVNIMAHSKGGIDGRQYAETSNRVNRLIMMGTPNAGSPLADKIQLALLASPLGFLGTAALNSLAGPAGVQLTTPYMLAYNLFHGSNADTDYIGIAGDYRFGTSFFNPFDLFFSGFLFGRSDLVVPTWSVGANSFTNYLGSIQTIGQDRDAIHFDPPLLGLNAGQIKSEQFAQRLVPLLAEPVEALARNFVPAPPIPEQLNTAPSVAGLIEEGQTVERTLTVDGSGDIRFGLIDLDGSIQMSLVSPNGTVITPTTVNPDISFDLALDGQGFRAAVYDVRSTAAVRGDWIVRLTAPNVNSTSNFAPYVVEAVSATSTISLATSTDRTGYRRGDPIRIEAVLRDASTPVLDGSVAAMVLKPDGQMTSLTLRDDGTQGDPTAGDGRYVGVLTDTQVGGTFRISVKANGSSTRPFSRESFVMAAVARSETRFTGNFIDRGVDLNSNGLFDRLVINAEIAVTHAGTYRYTAELTQNDGTLLQTVNGALGLSAGTQNLPLSFDGAAIYSARLNGPYRLKVLRLAEEEATDLLPLQDLTNAHTTAAYTFHQFEHDDIVALGTGSDQGVDTNANGKFDQLRVTTNVDVRQAGNYQYSARLEDADGTDLGFAAGSAVLPAGVSPIDLTFNGQSIGANGEDGPYFVKDLLIFSSSTNSANIEDVYTTSAYSASQFEGFVAATAVSSFTLVNASNEQDLMTIADGATISLARLPTRNLNVRANVTGSPIGSVVFKLDSQNPRIESAAPFALFGDTNGNYRNGSFALGQHTLIGTPFAGTGGTGTAGTPLTVNFTVIDRAITQFILVNADTEQDIIALTPNMTLNLATFPRNLNVRAVTNGEPVGSVRFNLDGGFARTENADPFALFGDDTSGDYFAGTFRTGNRTMTATPFALDNAKGAKGVPLTLKFKVINVIARGVNQTSAPQNPFSNWSIRGEAPRDLLNRHVADGIYPLTGDDRQQILRS